jgi:hypothetical protein
MHIVKKQREREKERERERERERDRGRDLLAAKLLQNDNALCITTSK